MILYRRGKLSKLDTTFWTPDRDYVQHCTGKVPNLQATLREGARVRRVNGSARRGVIHNAQNRKHWEVLVFTAWDWECDEYVILNPDVLQIARLRKRKK